ncbi:MAG: hypothetical protein AMXMBFR58_03290 [Phycisphaerae bacterium]
MLNAYWRHGRGERVGIIFEGLHVPHEDIRITEKEFEALAADDPSGKQIRLKIVPKELLHSDTAKKNFIEKHTLSAIASIVISRRDSNAQSVNFAMSLDTEREVDSILMASASQPLGPMLIAAAVKTDDFSGLKKRAASLYEILLLILATKAINDYEYQRACFFLRCLDDRLAVRHLDKTRQPRLAVRDMYVRLCIRQLKTKPSDLRDPEDARQAATELEKIIPHFGQDQPQCLVTYARLLYMADKVAEAKEVSQRIASLPHHELRRFGKMNLAFFALLDQDYNTAAKLYQELVASGEIYRFDLHDLVAFADACSLRGVQCGVFMRRFYGSLLKDHEASATEEIDCLRWISGDRRREVLRPLLLHKGPVAKRLAPEAVRPLRTKRKQKRRKG